LWDEAMSAQPEAVVPEVLAKCARLLGLRDIRVVDAYPAERYQVRESWMHELHIGESWSRGDLLLAILNKAAGMGVDLSLSFWPNTKCWAAGEVGKRQVATTPLEAAFLAFTQLERAHD
jgi:hypothetical protein